MKKQLYIVFLTLICLTTNAIIRYQFINKKTNQYIFDSWYSKNKIGFTLITKNDKCIKTEVVVTGDHLEFFLDSLKKCGYKKWKNATNVTQKYKCNITIDTLFFFKIVNNDSLFKFIYKYEITSQSNKIVNHLQTEFVTEKQQVLNGIENKSFTFSADKINGTTIIDISIVSPELLDANKQSIYQSGLVYGFYF